MAYHTTEAAKLIKTITLAAHRHNVNVLLSNSTFLIVDILVVLCRPFRSYR